MNARPNILSSISARSGPRAPSWPVLLALAVLIVSIPDKARSEVTPPLLANPFVAATPDPTKPAKVIECNSPPAPVKTVSIRSKYQTSDSTRSAIDSTAEDVYVQQITPILLFRQGLVNLANKYWRDPVKAASAGRCAWSWLKIWARGEALTDSRTDESLMALGQTLSAIALAYIQLADVPDRSDSQHLLVRRWMVSLAVDSMGYMTTYPERSSTRNNHRYWSGLGVAATGIATGRFDLLNWGVDSARLGLAQVTTDGYLPLELARGKRARDYHIFAAAPLSLIAVLGEANGVRLTSGERYALRNLLQRVVANLGEATHFEQKTGVVQIPFPDGLVQRHRIAFLEAFLSLENNTKVRAVLQNKRPVAYSVLGGDLTLLFGRSN